MTQTLTKRAQESLDSIDSMLAAIDRQKRSFAKQAASHTEAGGYTGETSHPVKNVDDGTDAASEGERSAENTADVKEDQGGQSVDSTEPGSHLGQDAVQLNIGTHQSTTGEDPSVETESAKGGKDDPGSSHPARTDNDSLDAHKYSAQAKQLLSLIKQSQALGTDLVAKLAVASDGQLKARADQVKQSMKAAADKLPPTTVDDADIDSDNPPPGKGVAADEEVGEKNAAEAGAMLADILTKQGGSQDRDAIVVGALQDTVQVAFDLAHKTAEYLDAYVAEKQAFGEEGPPPEEEEGGGEGEEAPPEAAGGGGGEGGGMDEEALLQLLAGGEGMGGEQAAASMGGPEAAGGMGGPEMGGGGGDEQAMLMQALQSLPPEQLQALLAQLGGGGGDPMAGGGDPMAGGGGDPMAAMGGGGGGMPPGKLAAFMQSQKQAATGWKPKTAAQAQQYRELVKYLNELSAAVA